MPIKITVTHKWPSNEDPNLSIDKTLKVNLSDEVELETLIKTLDDVAHFLGFDNVSLGEPNGVVKKT